MNAMQPRTPINTQFLNEFVLEEAAGASVFARGRKLVGAVTILACDENIAHATVQGSLLYQVSMQWKPMLFGICTCPFNFEGDFCKHLVALGLALLNPGDSAQGEGAPVVDPLAEELKWLLRRRGFIGYSEALDFADEIEDFCNTLEYQLELGFADAVASLALKLTTGLRRMLEVSVDDSGGAVGDACQRALDIYAAACSAGNPDGRKLGRWLAKFNLESPGWPEAPLSAFCLR